MSNGPSQRALLPRFVAALLACLIVSALGIFATGFVHAMAWSGPVKTASRVIGEGLSCVLPRGQLLITASSDPRPRSRAPIPPGDVGCFIYAIDESVTTAGGRAERAFDGAGGEWHKLAAAHLIIACVVLTGMRLGQAVIAWPFRTGRTESRLATAPVLTILALSSWVAVLWPFLAQAAFVVWRAFIDACHAGTPGLGDAASLDQTGAGSLGVGAVLCDAMTIATAGVVLGRGGRTGEAVADGLDAREGRRSARGWLLTGWIVSVSCFAGPIILAWIGRAAAYGSELAAK